MMGENACFAILEMESISFFFQLQYCALSILCNINLNVYKCLLRPTILAEDSEDISVFGG